MNEVNLLENVWEKTQAKKLNWGSMVLPYELVAAFGGEYVLRIVGPHSYADEDGEQQSSDDIRLTLETASGQVIVSASSREGPQNVHILLNGIWEMIRCGGKSAQEALDDAVHRLGSL